MKVARKIYLLFIFLFSQNAYSADLQLLYPSIGTNDFIGLESGKVSEHYQLSLGIFSNYSHNTFDLYKLIGKELYYYENIVRHRLDNNLIINIGLWDIIDVGVVMPVVIQDKLANRETERLGLRLSESDPLIIPGSLQFRGKLQLVKIKELFATSVSTNISFPTTKRYTLIRERYITPTFKLSSSLHTDVLSIGLSAGYKYRYKESSLYNIKLDDEFMYGVAIALHMTDNIDLIGELKGFMPAKKIRYNMYRRSAQDVVNSTRHPAELDFGIKSKLNEEWVAILGGGFGIRNGYGAPKFRVFAGVVYNYNLEDEVTQEVINPIDNDPDRDGIYGTLDYCPFVPEDKDGFEDLDGCPDYDNDNDTILDIHDRCPMLFEKIPQDGCPSLIFVHNKIFVEQTVEFEIDSDEISYGYNRVLDEIAEALLHLEDVKLIIVEGHTDSTADEDYNLELSRRRSSSVRKALINKGVPEDILESKGFGETIPVASNETPEGRRKNRRVEFLVIKIGE